MSVKELPLPTTTAQLVVRRLKQHGIERAFGVVGGAIMYITEALRREDGIRCVFTHHEQGAAIAAEAYSKITNKPALLFATAGPGATNVITGVADAYMDSVPMIVILGDVRCNIAADFNKQRYNAPQEVNQAALMKPVLKDYLTLTPDMDSNRIIDAIDDLVLTAVGGRPGPVCIAIPLDVQGKSCDASSLASPTKISARSETLAVKPVWDSVETLLGAKRPLVLLGAGVRITNAITQVEAFLSRYRLPWCVSIGAVDLQDNTNPLSCGCVGPTSQRAANTLLKAADCVLALGTSFDQSVTGFNIAGLLGNKKVFVVNIDPGEQLRFHDPQIQFIEIDLADYFRALTGKVFVAANHESWRDQIQGVKSILNSNLEASLRTTVGQGFLSAYDISDEISRHLPSDATVVLGISLDAHSVFNAFKVTSGQRVIVSRNLGPMGWDIPAVLGAAQSTEQPRIIVLITGDGSLMLNVQELSIIVGQQIPVCIFIYSNDGYASIRTTQMNFFGKQFFGCNRKSGLYVPPFQSLARGYGLEYDELSNLKSIAPLIKRHMNEWRPRIVECRLDPGQLREPRLVTKEVDGIFRTPPVHDMTPALGSEVSRKLKMIFPKELD